MSTPDTTILFQGVEEKTERKKMCFEYIIDKFSQHTGGDITSFSKLKILKLLFFVSAVSYKDDTKHSLLDIFDEFVAMPYGPVESCIYNHLHELSKYKITSKECSIKNTCETSITTEDISLIDDAVESLLAKNSQILGYTAFQLVDLSHKWSCWKICFDLARKHNRSSLPMPVQMIKNSVRYYQ